MFHPVGQQRGRHERAFQQILVGDEQIRNARRDQVLESFSLGNGRIGDLHAVPELRIKIHSVTQDQIVRIFRQFRRRRDIPFRWASLPIESQKMFTEVHPVQITFFRVRMPEQSADE